MKKQRCAWVTNDPLYIAYHDQEWGQPVFDDERLFELLILEGAQAGLSWLTILKRRDGYRTCFHNFDIKKVADMTAKDQERLRKDERIIRNRLKIQSAIQNANAVLHLQSSGISFSDYLWNFVDGNPIVNHFKTLADVPTNTTLSDQLSKDLKKRGFNFVGSTICYAFMQAAGMVDDHTAECYMRDNG